MPKRKRESKKVDDLIENALLDILLLQTVADSDDDSLYDDMEDAIYDDLMTNIVGVKNHNKKQAKAIHNDTIIRTVLKMDESTFKYYFCVNREVFDTLYELIKNADVLKTSTTESKQIQLLIVLYRLGIKGSNTTMKQIKKFFHIKSEHVIQKTTARIFAALLEHECHFLSWPDVTMRRQIVDKALVELPHCIGTIVTTKVKLSFTPRWNNAMEYLNHVGTYAVKIMAVCDNEQKVNYIKADIPANADTNEIYSDCDLATKAAKYFDGEQCLIANSNYKLTATVLTPYSACATDGTKEQRNAFNSVLFKILRRNGQHFTLIKQRFRSLQNLWLLEDEQTLNHISCWLKVCVLINNLIGIENDVDEEEEAEFIVPNLTDTGDCGSSNDEVEYEDVKCIGTVDGELKRRALLEGF